MKNWIPIAVIIAAISIPSAIPKETFKWSNAAWYASSTGSQVEHDKIPPLESQPGLPPHYIIKTDGDTFKWNVWDGKRDVLEENGEDSFEKAKASAWADYKRNLPEDKPIEKPEVQKHEWIMVTEAQAAADAAEKAAAEAKQKEAQAFETVVEKAIQELGHGCLIRIWDTNQLFGCHIRSEPLPTLATPSGVGIGYVLFPITKENP